MVNLNMNGPYILSMGEITKAVTKISAGNYVLGDLNDRDVFIVEYVGRSDADVAVRLKQHVGEKYKKFLYSYASSPRAAFLEECRNYHAFGGSKDLDNDMHPRRPAETNWKCPCCRVFE